MKLKLFFLLLLMTALTACTPLQELIQAGGERLALPGPETQEQAATLTPAFPIPLSPSETPALMRPGETDEPSNDFPNVPVIISTPTLPEDLPEHVLPTTPGSGLEVQSERAYYVPQQGTPVMLPNFSYPNLGCAWLGVGGQVFGSDGWPVQMLVVELKGSLAGQVIEMITLTGAAQQWGPGGYEFTLADRPIASQRTLYLQFYNIDGEEVSERIIFDTDANCESNSLMINMVQAPRPGSKIYFPLVPYDRPIPIPEGD
jgi:hypothetical protein